MPFLLFSGKPLDLVNLVWNISLLYISVYHTFFFCFHKTFCSIVYLFYKFFINLYFISNLFFFIVWGAFLIFPFLSSPLLLLLLHGSIFGSVSENFMYRILFGFALLLYIFCTNLYTNSFSCIYSILTYMLSPSGFLYICSLLLSPFASVHWNFIVRLIFLKPCL